MITRQIADPSDRIEIRNAMVADERAAGATLVAPGELPWLATEDWLDDVVVTLLGKDVRLVWLNARGPGKGAFTRLIAGIEAANLRPVVIDPLSETDAILRRWGWVPRVVGRDVDRITLWRPRKQAR